MPVKYTTCHIDEELPIRLDEEGFGSRPPITIIDAFRSILEQCASKPALHTKQNGEWSSITFQEYYDQCLRFGKSLIHLGLTSFEAVSILGFNAPEWFFSNFGAIFAGNVPTGIYTTSTPSACEHIAKHSGSRVVVCDGMMQLEKLIAVHKNLPKLKALVVYNVSSLPDGLSCDVPVYTFEEFLQLGKHVSDERIVERMNSVKPGNCCILIYTSGTTGAPKGVMLSHDNILASIGGYQCMLERTSGHKMNNEDRVISFLPLSHIAGQAMDMYWPLLTGLQVYFAQPDAMKGTLIVTVKEVRPTFFLAVPRVWEKMAEKMWAVSKESTGLKKMIADWAKSRGTLKSKLAQYGNSGGEPCGFGIAHALVLRRVKEALGLDQCRLCISGAAPMSATVAEYFASLDIPIYGIYGMSENSGPQCCAVPNRWKVNTCGLTIDGSKCRVDENTQELLFKGRNVMMGYLNNEEQTREMIDEDGWLHTGDCGEVDKDGFVTITGRIKELIVTSGGENIPPIVIEDVIKEEIPIISNAMVIGDHRKFLSVLLGIRVVVDSEGHPTQNLDSQTLHICKEIGSTAKTSDEASVCPKIKAYIDEGIKRTNARATSRAQNIAKYELIPTDFSIVGGELTPTLKVRRKQVLDKYSKLVEKMYT